MSHKLRQAMQGHRLREHGAEAVPQIMRTEVGNLGQASVFRNEMIQCTGANGRRLTEH